MFGIKALLVATLLTAPMASLYGGDGLVVESSATGWALSVDGTTDALGDSTLDFYSGIFLSGECLDDVPYGLDAKGTIAIGLRTPRFHFSYGNIFTDPRFSVFSKTGFQLNPLGLADYGTVKVSLMDWDHLSSGSWDFNTTYFHDTRIHLFGFASRTWRSGAGLGMLVEVDGRTGILRFSGLVVDYSPPATDPFMIEHRARPLGKGFSSFLGWSGRVGIEDLELSITPKILVRAAYDRKMGTSLVILYRLQVDLARLSLFLERVEASPWVGSIGTSDTIISDIPMRREILGLAYTGDGWNLEASIQDSWWYRTFYAGESQKRTIVSELSGMYRRGQGEYGMTLGYRKKNNRSGSQTDTIKLEFPLSTTISACTLTLSPSLGWASDFSFGIRLECAIELGDTGELEARLKVRRNWAKIDLNYTRRLPGGQLSIGLDNEGTVKFNCSIDLGG